ncbi:MAG: DUF885 domain-containing protein, partial [Lachnospiraceae bacterium]|nr:DUF885 domain-containing protein [Lachnospiraceae bacterium]
MKHRRIFALLIMLVMLAGLAGCSGGSDGKQTETQTETKGHNGLIDDDPYEGTDSEKFDAYCLDCFLNDVYADRLDLHYFLKDPSAYDMELADPGFGELDMSTWNDERDQLLDELAYLRHLDYDALTDMQKVDYDVIVAYYEDMIGLYDMPYYQEMLDSVSGIQAELPILLAEYAFYGQQDVEDYLVLLDNVDDYFEKIMKYEREKSEAGLFMPDALVDRVVKQCSDFIADPDSNLLIEVFPDKLDELGDQISSDDRARYIEKNNELVRNVVIPAYQSLIDGLTALKGTAKNQGGLAGLPKGKQYYIYLLRSSIGTDKSPEELAALIEERIKQDLNEVSSVVMEDPDLYFEIQDVKYAHTDPEETLEYLKTAMLDRFPAAADAQYTIKYVHKSLEESLSPAFYLQCCFDDYKNNLIFFNNSSNYTPETRFPVVAHEGYPGHLYQTTFLLSTDPNPYRYLLSFPGYMEGWAEYVQKISYSYGGISEKAARLLALDEEFALLIYCRIDIGIHYEGWSKDDVQKYLKNYGIEGDDIIDQIYYPVLERPTDYLEYGIGSIEWEELKAMAQEGLGENFDEVDFHKYMLTLGKGQYFILRNYVEK